MDIKLDTELLDDTIAKYHAREKDNSPKYIVVENTSLKDLTIEVNHLLDTSKYELNGGITVVANKIMHYRQLDAIEKSYVQSLRRTY